MLCDEDLVLVHSLRRLWKEGSVLDVLFLSDLDSSYVRTGRVNFKVDIQNWILFKKI